MRKSKEIAIIAFVLYNLINIGTVCAETPQIEWIDQFGTSYGDTAEDIVVNSDGDIYISGYTSGVLPEQTGIDGLAKACVRKYSPDGTVLWTNQFVTRSVALEISLDSSGNVYVAGNTAGAFPDQTNDGYTDGFVRKYSPEGTVLMTLQFGASSYVSLDAFSLDSSGNIYVAGNTVGAFPDQTNEGLNDAFVRKYSPEGTILWTDQFGSSYIDKINGISIDSSGVYICGHTMGTLPGQTTGDGWDGFMRKYSPNGDVLWTQQSGVIGQDEYEGISVDSSGDIYVTGWRSGAFVSKYSTEGNLLWDDSTIVYSSWGRKIHTDFSGIYVTGITSETFPGQTNAGNTDFYVQKYSPDGIVLWTIQFGTPYHDIVNGISVGSSGIYVTGYTEDAERDVLTAKIIEISENQPPTCDIVGPYTGYEGVAISFYGTGSDTDGDTLTYHWDFGDDTATSSEQNTIHVYVDNGVYTVTLTVSDGEISVTDSTTVTVNNVVPTANLGNDGPTVEGSSVLVSFSDQYDPGTSDTFTYSFDWDNDGIYDIADQTISSAKNVWYDNGVYTVKGMIKDNDGGFSEYTTDVTVTNVDPVVGLITAPIDPVAVGTEITATADFTDPGTLDPHTAVWEWNLGIDPDDTSDGTVTESLSSGSVTDSHTYPVAGIYTVKLTVFDKDGGEGWSEYRYVVVYDPNDGFVTGGGWINSPEGAYPSNPSLTGKATFGFHSKYMKGAIVPTGKTEFHFEIANQFADLKFHSDDYQWLVISGAKAKYKGTGTINDIGNYGFMLTAIDGDIKGYEDGDMFRIKIWDLDNENAIIYDNEFGKEDDADATTIVQEGSIIIHKE